MKKIGLLSDTHAHLDPKVFEYFSSCDEIWHAGDFGSTEVSDKLAAFRPLRGVYGNIDGQELRIIHPLHLQFRCEDLNVWITHIGGYPGHYPAEIKAELRKKRVDLFICGHSHILRIMRDREHHQMLMMNPGAAGLEGFHKMRTLIRFTISGKLVSDVEVVELGKRG